MIICITYVITVSAHLDIQERSNKFAWVFSKCSFQKLKSNSHPSSLKVKNVLAFSVVNTSPTDLPIWLITIKGVSSAPSKI